jgi:CDP-4-dehydro-6-deoxyglucose reductase
MLEELAESPSDLEGKSVRVYWGGRTTADIYSRIAYGFPDFKFTPVLSRASGDWKGRTGYVQNALLEDNIELGNSIVYACGSDQMIHAARTSLCRAGLPADMFYSDAFVSSD